MKDAAFSSTILEALLKQEDKRSESHHPWQGVLAAEKRLSHPPLSPATVSWGRNIFMYHNDLHP